MIHFISKLFNEVRKMKKIILIVIIIIIMVTSLKIYQSNTNNNDISLNYSPKINIEETPFLIDNYYVYGRTFNFTSTLPNINTNFNQIKLVSLSSKTTYYELIFENNTITLSNHINEGIILDELNLGEHYFFIELTYQEDTKEIKKYYPLINNTSYDNILYNSLSKFQKDIELNFNNEYKTLKIDVNKSVKNNAYDIVLDPGHGGTDIGASVDGYKESELTLKLSKSLKKELENYGYKVKLTRGNDLKIDEYNEGGRAIIPQEVNAKYTFSIHYNSSIATKANGIEIYTPHNINYELPKTIAQNLVKDTGIGYSTNIGSKREPGIYTRLFTNEEIAKTNNGYIAKGNKPYNIKEYSNYYYMIRETGGIITGAFINNINKKTIGVNPYYNSNKGVETYLLELGYLTNSQDLNIITTQTNSTAKSIAKSIDSYLQN